MYCYRLVHSQLVYIILWKHWLSYRVGVDHEEGEFFFFNEAAGTIWNGTGREESDKTSLLPEKVWVEASQNVNTGRRNVKRKKLG